jgi:hypothetical protein
MKTRNATRASEGLPRKRPSYDLEDLRPSRPKKQIRQPPKKRFPLMKLPAEIRLKILRELLWQPEPLKITREMHNLHPLPISAQFLYPSNAREHYYGTYFVETTNYAFHPAILAVCRKLNEEGRPVLYEENIVDVTVYCDQLQFEEYKCDWMGYPSDLESVSESLSQLARKLQITVQVRCPKDVSSANMRRSIRELVKVLQANPQWCSLDIRLENHVPDHLIKSPSVESHRIQLDEEVLRPFSLLRRLHHVDITGVSPQFAARLSNLMKSDNPVTDLPKMYNSLERYASLFVNDELGEPDEGFPEEYLDLAEEAMDAGNAKDFYNHRGKMMWEVEKFMRRERADVFKDDPDPVFSRLSNHDFIASQERRENMQRKKDFVEALQSTISESEEELVPRKESPRTSRGGSEELWNAGENFEDDSVSEIEEHIANCGKS